MPAAWMAYATVLTLLAALGALAAERLACIWRGPRRFVWVAVLVGAAFVPPILAARRAPVRSLPESMAGPVAESSGRASPAAAARGRPSPSSSRAVRRGPFVQAREIGSTLRRYLIPAWILTSMALLSAYAVAMARLRRRLSGWPIAELDGARVHVAPNAGPAVIGILRPRIVVPSWALSLGDRERLLMLRHELEHVRANDSRLWHLAGLVLLVFPWNIGLWLVARRLRLAIEIDCDRRVLGDAEDPRDYGMLLLAVGARRSGPLLPGTGLVEHGAHIERRIRAMTASRPRHPILASIPLVVGIGLLTMAASHAPHPQPLLLPNSANGYPRPSGRIRDLGQQPRARPQSESATHSLAPRVGQSNDTIPKVPAARSQRRQRPRITVTWENAPIEAVIAAFARFSGRKIEPAEGVTGLITASVTDQPWNSALELIMHANGYRVITNPDSSITISPGSDSRGKGRQRDRSSARDITGSVVDDSTNAPIRGVEVQVIGVQAMGQPNRACTNDRGEFRMRVPNGEVWLDASAPSYEFKRITLKPHEGVATFRGRQIARRPLVDSLLAAIGNDQIESVTVIKGARAIALYGPSAANGVVVIRTKSGKTLMSEPPAVSGQIRLISGPTLGSPIFLVDGVVMGPLDQELTAAPCRPPARPS